MLLTVSFLWVGAFASAGGTALAALVDWPAGWSERGRTLLWAHASMGLLLGAGVGVIGNLATTLMTCLLAYALLLRGGIYPEGYRASRRMAGRPAAAPLLLQHVEQRAIRAIFPVDA